MILWDDRIRDEDVRREEWSAGPKAKVKIRATYVPTGDSVEAVTDGSRVLAWTFLMGRLYERLAARENS